eukprot:1142355-Pelagomonas_calceolata.AAC.12
MCLLFLNWCRECSHCLRGGLGGQHSNGAGIVGCGPEGRPSSLEIPRPIFGGSMDVGWQVVSKGSYGSNLTHMDVGMDIGMDVGSVDRLAKHDLHITKQVFNRAIPPYLFHPSIPDQARRTFSRPDAISVTPCPAYPN